MRNYLPPSTLLVAVILGTHAVAASHDVSRKPAAPSATLLPALSVSVHVQSKVSRGLLARVLEEADAIWAEAGVRFAWQTPQSMPALMPFERSFDDAATLRVVVGDEPGSAAAQETSLGWVTFEPSGIPQPEVHISRANALSLLRATTPTAGAFDRMPPAEVDTYLGRALGRALAHEIGHFLLATKMHTPGGLMQATRTAFEFFAGERKSFGVDAAQRVAVAARLS